MDKTTRLIILLSLAFAFTASMAVFIAQSSTFACHRGAMGMHCHLEGLDHGHRTAIQPLKWLD
ncbi:MAG: hypothetical protein AAGD96_24060 [Chloroflexota bacterium]